MTDVVQFLLPFSLDPEAPDVRFICSVLGSSLEVNTGGWFGFFFVCFQVGRLKRAHKNTICCMFFFLWGGIAFRERMLGMLGYLACLGTFGFISMLGY